MHWRQFIKTESNICHGRPCIHGTRVTVSVRLDNLAERRSLDEIRRSYPTGSLESVQAAIAHSGGSH